MPKLQKLPEACSDTIDLKYFGQPGSAGFKVRGENYLADKKKVCGAARSIAPQPCSATRRLRCCEQGYDSGAASDMPCSCWCVVSACTMPIFTIQGPYKPNMARSGWPDGSSMGAVHTRGAGDEHGKRQPDHTVQTDLPHSSLPAFHTRLSGSFHLFVAGVASQFCRHCYTTYTVLMLVQLMPAHPCFAGKSFVWLMSLQRLRS